MSKFTFFLALPHNIQPDELEDTLVGIEVQQHNDIWNLKIADFQEITDDKKKVKKDFTEEEWATVKGWHSFNIRKVPIRENAGIGLNKDSIATDGSWDIWVVSPEGFDLNGDGRIDYTEWKTGTKLFRKLARFNKHSKNKDIDNKAYIQGPWSAKELQRKFGADVDCILYMEAPDEVDSTGGGITILSWKFIKDDGIRIPWVYAGESPEGLADIDYNPSNSDIDADVEAEKTALFPDPEPPH